MRFIIISFFSFFLTFFLSAEMIDMGKPVIVQNYPVDNMLTMNKAELSYKAIGELIESAKQKIDIEVFYIDKGDNDSSELMKYILKPLIAKAKSGIQIRIIVDRNMDKFYPTDWLSKKSDNIKVRKIITFDQSGVMHAKMILVDDLSFYLGSHNLDWVTFQLNHELGVILRNKKLAESIKAVFDSDWKNHNNKAMTKVDPGVSIDGNLKITFSPDLSVSSDVSGGKEFIRLINSAEKSISMQAMQVIGFGIYSDKGKKWKEFIKAILDAADRNVDVKIMMSDWEFTEECIDMGNKFLLLIKEKDKKNKIKIRYSSFPKHKPCVPYSEVDHAKYMVIDDNTTWISTANITESYFTSCRNYSLTVSDDKKFTEELKNIFNTMWNSKYTKPYTGKVTAVTDNTCKGGK